MRSRQHKDNVDIKLIDTFFSQFPADILSQIFTNARDTQWSVKILFLNPFSEQAQLRARLLNDSPIRRSNAGLFNILAAMKYCLLRESASEVTFNRDESNESFLHSQINELSELGKNNRISIRFYTEITATHYIIDDFAVGGFLMHGGQAIDGPHIVFVNDKSQDNDVFDSLNRNFDNIWNASSAVPSSIDVDPRYHVFLSYSAKDGAIAALLADYLSSKGISTFCAAKTLTVGDPFKAEVR